MYPDVPRILSEIHIIRESKGPSGRERKKGEERKVRAAEDRPIRVSENTQVASAHDASRYREKPYGDR